MFGGIYTQLSQPTKAFLESAAVGAAGQTKAYSLAVARVFSAIAALPTTQIDDIRLYYLTNVKLETEQLLAQVAEVMVIDTDTIRKKIEDFYTARYYMAYPRSFYPNFDKAMAIPTFFGFADSISAEDCNVIIDECLKINSIINQINTLVSEIKTITAPKTAGDN